MSGAWGGQASDQKITRESGLLEQLHPGQQVMADRGFTIESMLQERGNDLVMAQTAHNCLRQKLLEQGILPKLAFMLGEQ